MCSRECCRTAVSPSSWPRRNILQPVWRHQQNPRLSESNWSRRLTDGSVTVKVSRPLQCHAAYGGFARLCRVVWCRQIPGKDLLFSHGHMHAIFVVGDNVWKRLVMDGWGAAITSFWNDLLKLQLPTVPPCARHFQSAAEISFPAARDLLTSEAMEGEEAFFSPRMWHLAAAGQRLLIFLFIYNWCTLYYVRQLPIFFCFSVIFQWKITESTQNGSSLPTTLVVTISARLLNKFILKI